MIEGVLLIAHLAPSRTHAEASGASVLRATRGSEDLVDFHRGRGLHKGLVAGGLGTVRAVFGAAAGLDGEERALLYFGRVPVHSVSGGGLVHQLVEREVVDLGDFGLGPVVSDRGCDA